MTDRRYRGAQWLLGLIMLVWFVGQMFGASWLDNNWSFTHWQVMTGWYGIIWLLLGLAITYLLLKYVERIGSIMSGRRAAYIALSVLFVLTVVLQFDSFVHGGGNLRVGQIAQAPVIIFRWFEFGSVVVATVLFKFFGLFFDYEHAAGGLAWRVIAFASTAACIVASAKLVSELTTSASRRITWFIILFFGPQTLLYFGFIGVEPIVVACTLWFALYANRLHRRFSIKSLGLLWAMAILAVLLHYTGAFLLPAAVYLSIATPGRRNVLAYAGLAASLATVAVLLTLLYQHGQESLSFSRILLPVQGAPPHTDYTLYSWRRISDIFQIFFLLAPLAIVARFMTLRATVWKGPNHAMIAANIMAFAGVLVIIVHNPIHSVVLDLPRMACYLTPFAFVLLLALAAGKDDEPGRSRLSILVAAASIALPLGYAPVHLDLDRTAEFARPYFDKHDAFHRTGGLAMRDAYFYNAEYKKADAWEVELPINSIDYLNMRGCVDLMAAGEFNEAAKILKQMVAENPCWTEPREALAVVYLRTGRPEPARLQIDTCLLLEPYRKQCHVNLYNFYRRTGNLARSLITIEQALSLFPGDRDIMSDQMKIYYMLRDLPRADSLAGYLIEAEPNLPHPHLIRAKLCEIRGDPSSALEYYRTFVTLAPRDPEALDAMDKIETLTEQVQKPPTVPDR